MVPHMQASHEMCNPSRPDEQYRLTIKLSSRYCNVKTEAPIRELQEVMEPSLQHRPTQPSGSNAA
mgnify:CR=1 FL=1|jgi:hypothetical protein